VNTWKKRRSREFVLSVLVIGTSLLVPACGGAKEVMTEPLEATVVSTLAEPSPAETERDSLDSHLQSAEAYFEDGEYDSAVVELEAAIDLDPDNVDAHTNLALCHFEKGDYKGAAAEWTRVAELDPEQDLVYLERGTCYFNLARHDDAIEDLTEAIARNETSADAYRVRGKSYAFLEDYEQAVADLTRTIELDPTADEAYLNRAVSMSKIGGLDDLTGIVTDLGMVLQLSEDDGMRAQAESMLENLLASVDDPALIELAQAALAGEVIAEPADEGELEASFMGIDVTRAPGHSIGVEESLDPGEAHRFLLLASPGDTVGAGVTSAANLLVGVQNAATGQILQAVPSGSDPLFVAIPENALYHIVIEGAGGVGGGYMASFEASPKVSFALDPRFFAIGRLPEAGPLYYTYSAHRGSTLRGNVIPHPDTPVDLIVEVLELESRNGVAEYDQSGPGKNERFSFTIPSTEPEGLRTYIVSITSSDGSQGAYALVIESDDAEPSSSNANTPEDVVLMVFDAASSGQFDRLADLCDPRGENDGDTQMICDLASDETHRDPFVEAFAKGRLLGEAQISPDGTAAEVSFAFGPEGDQEETMELINRDGPWYLHGF